MFHKKREEQSDKGQGAEASTPIPNTSVSSAFGKTLKIQIFGGSHEPHIGVTIEGLPIGTQIDMEQLNAFLVRRAPGNSPFATPRKEADLPIPIEGISMQENSKGLTTESSVTFIIENTNTNSSDYKGFTDVPRPGHADYTAYMKYGENTSDKGPNMAGGGPFSARMTAPLCIAGGIALQILEKMEIFIGAHIYSIKDTEDIPFDGVNVSIEDLNDLSKSRFPVFSQKAGAAMQAEILNAKENGDSLGGVVEVCALGLSPGLGGPMYDGVESAISPIFFGIPAVKGLEFGAGFKSTHMLGSLNNDGFCMEGGRVKTVTNYHGGILGGITSGMPLIARLAFKPTPSIAKVQDSVSLSRRENVKLSVKGRHDPCVVVRAVPICEAALALGLLDIIYSQ